MISVKQSHYVLQYYQTNTAFVSKDKQAHKGRYLRYKISSLNKPHTDTKYGVATYMYVCTSVLQLHVRNFAKISWYFTSDNKFL